MAWFSRKKPQGEAPGPRDLETGVHRSPGLAALLTELDRRRIEAILDLGASSTENVGFLSRYCKNISIQDLFRSVSDDGSARRSSIFRFPDAAALTLPAPAERFDVVLMWDLIHYFETGELRRFIARLAAICRPEALLFLAASSSAPIPLVPIQFKIEDRELLHYTVPEGERSERSQLRTRQVEGLMAGFEPVRYFQLRNGLQEFLFRYAGSPEEEDSTEPGLPPTPPWP